MTTKFFETFHIFTLWTVNHVTVGNINGSYLKKLLFCCEFPIDKDGCYLGVTFASYVTAVKRITQVQVNLCPKLLFLHQLNHNMMTDCSLNYKFSNSMNNLLSYCGLVDARISAFEKDLPATPMFIH